MLQTMLLEELVEGQKIIFGGNKISLVSHELAENFQPGDRLIVIQETGDLLRVPLEVQKLVKSVVDKSISAFHDLAGVEDEQVSNFFTNFANNLRNPDIKEKIFNANLSDLVEARRKSRSTTRLELTEEMYQDMIDGLEIWSTSSSNFNKKLEEVAHSTHRISNFTASSGVVGFVFEGRPNVLVDACGVIKSRNSVVLRIGSDALGTAKAIMGLALTPSLIASQLPVDSVGLIDSTSHSSGWELFSDSRLALAVARGSGKAVLQLGSIARQSGTSVSLHGQGGSWLIVSENADPKKLYKAILNSLDRKVCNTLNTIVFVGNGIVHTETVLNALKEAGSRKNTFTKMHILDRSKEYFPDELFHEEVKVSRADGDHVENLADLISQSEVSTEWEWEGSPEVTLMVSENLETGVNNFNTFSSKFVISLISQDASEHEYVWRYADAPFVSNGFTRWVDGQYAFDRPELGLSNWQYGRILSRPAILSSNDLYSVRTFFDQIDPDVSR